MLFFNCVRAYLEKNISVRYEDLDLINDKPIFHLKFNNDGCGIYKPCQIVIKKENSENFPRETESESSCRQNDTNFFGKQAWDGTTEPKSDLTTKRTLGFWILKITKWRKF